MRYITRAGIVLEIRRIDRRLLDALAVPEPQPPTRPVETWGGLVEQVPVYADPSYRAAMLEYQLRYARDLMNILATGITVLDEDRARGRLQALEEVVGKQDNLALGFLRYGTTDIERAEIVELILYQSTVTQKAIDEASARFGYKWRGKPLIMWRIPMSHGERGKLGVEWKAANRSGLTWAQFCDLSGPEQSQHVAFWMLEDKLAYLLQQPN
jgi:hypothetical protein